MNTKKIMIFILLQLSAWGLMANPGYADTLSDLRYTCGGCHNYAVSPSGWSLDGGVTSRICREKTVAEWKTTLGGMQGKGGFSAIGPTGATSFDVAAEFLYAMQYTTTPTLSPTPTFTATPTPTFTPTATPTTGTGPHTWYDYDYMGGRCFAKDHAIMERKWCEQHGMKGGGNHSALTGYDRHAHLDSPGQKP